MNEHRILDPIQQAENDAVHDKSLRQRIDALLIELNAKGISRSRERSLAITKLDEAVMWLGMDLKRIGTITGTLPNPYPTSKDPTSGPGVHPTAEGLTFGDLLLKLKLEAQDRLRSTSHAPLQPPPWPKDASGQPKPLPEVKPEPSVEKMYETLLAQVKAMSEEDRAAWLEENWGYVSGPEVSTSVAQGFRAILRKSELESRASAGGGRAPASPIPEKEDTRKELHASPQAREAIDEVNKPVVRADLAYLQSLGNCMKNVSEDANSEMRWYVAGAMAILYIEHGPERGQATGLDLPQFIEENTRIDKAPEEK